MGTATTTTLARAVAFAPAFPALGAILVGALLLRRRPPPERAVAAIAQIAVWLAALCVFLGAGAFFAGGGQPLDVRLGHVYQAGDYGFELVFLVDGLSITVALLTAVLLLATSRFSLSYLHREPGYVRFFLLILTFGSGMLLLVLAGSYDVLFAGWEVVGLVSVLLVGFFQERRGPVRAALRVLITYRLCDIGLLVAAVWLHLTLHTTVFVEIAAHLRPAPTGPLGAEPPAALIGLCLLLAAMGKSAQFPVGGWLPRAMEGPTASSAVFYGGLSVHAGVYLLIRSAPLLHHEHALLAPAALVCVGGVTALMAALSGQAAADAKTGLAYATISQVGLMVLECGLGLYRLATLHLVAHALLRYYQFLRTPSALQDALGRRAALGMTQPDEAARSFERSTLGVRRFLYRLAIERFEVEAALDRFLARPVLSAARRLGSLEARLLARLARTPAPPTPPAPPAPSTRAPGGAP